jgi:2'-5' RNA ligase
MNQPPLYLTALLPPPELAAREYAVKQAIAEKYNTHVAITKPAHITLVPPYNATEEQLDKLIPIHEGAAHQSVPFELVLDGFGCFEGNKTVFIDVQPSGPLQQLYTELKAGFIKVGQTKEKHFHAGPLRPHLTVAFRDLSPETFAAIWQAYEHEPFTANFPVNGIWIMKYVDKVWVPWREFGFKC